MKDLMSIQPNDQLIRAFLDKVLNNWNDSEAVF